MERRPRARLVQTIIAQAREIVCLKAELAERREQYRLLLQQIPFPTWLYCRESLRFLDVNDAAVALYGWSRAEFLRMTIADIRPLEEVPALMSSLRRMQGVAGGQSGPFRHRHKDGSLVEVTVSFESLTFAGRSARLIVASAATCALGLAPPPQGSPAATGLGGLSPREREIFALVARGHTSDRIAQGLGLSRKSVETYRARFAQKLGLRSRADIVGYALAHGILVPGRAS